MECERYWSNFTGDYLLEKILTEFHQISKVFQVSVKKKKKRERQRDISSKMF